MSSPANAGAPSTFPLVVSSDHAVPVEAPTSSTIVQNLAGGTVFYADKPQVSSASYQGTIAAGSQHTFTSQAWLIGSAGAPASCVVTISGLTSDITLVTDPTSGAQVVATSQLPQTVQAVAGIGTPSNPVTNPAAPRPTTGLAVVYWQCSTQPTNLAPGDIWIKYP